MTSGSHTVAPTSSGVAHVPYDELHGFVSEVFAARGVPPARADLAASALCYGDLCGFDSHGVFNLARLYLPLFDSGRVDPTAEPDVVTDLGASAVVDARRSLGLWSAAEAVDDAVARAETHGVGMVSVRGGTHFGCAGFHTLRAARRGMIGIVASNCGGQRIARPPAAAVTMLGTNPLSVAAPAVDEHPFVLDMSTTVVPTGKVRTAANAGETVPDGWLMDEAGATVRDPASFDRGGAHLRWLGGGPDTGMYKGYGLGLAVEVLAAALSGAALGPAPEALRGDGGPNGQDDDIGFFVLAIAGGTVYPGFDAATRTLFSSLLACPPSTPDELVRYPGWWEAERAERRRRTGVPVRDQVHRELVALGLRDQRRTGGR